MPIVIEFTGRYAAPKILYDHCGKMITTAEDGNYQWSNAAGTEGGQTTALFFTHKGCCDAFEHTRGDPYAWNAIGLECLPYFLAENLHVSWQEARAKARRMAGL